MIEIIEKKRIREDRNIGANLTKTIDVTTEVQRKLCIFQAPGEKQSYPTCRVVY